MVSTTTFFVTISILFAVCCKYTICEKALCSYLEYTLQPSSQYLLSIF